MNTLINFIIGLVLAGACAYFSIFFYSARQDHTTLSTFFGISSVMAIIWAFTRLLV